MKNIIGKITAVLLLILLAGCSNLNNSENTNEKNYTLQGNIVFNSEKGAVPGFSSTNQKNRTAGSNFTKTSGNEDVTFTITASKEGQTPVTKEVSSDFTLTLPAAGVWALSAQATSSGTKVYGWINVTVDDTLKSVKIPVTPTVTDSSGKGSINLEIYDESGRVKSAKAEYKVNGEDIEKELTYEDQSGLSVFTFTHNDIPYGKYSTAFSFYDKNDKVIYTCTEAVAVYPGFETSTWIGDSSHIVRNLFVIDDDLLKLQAKKSWIALWNKGDEEYYLSYDESMASWISYTTDFERQKGIQLFPEIPEQGEVTSPLSLTNSNIDDFCFDEDNNLYVLNGTTVSKYIYGFAEYYGDTTYDIYSKLQEDFSWNINYSVKSIQCAGGYIWIILHGENVDDVSDQNEYDYITAITRNFNDSTHIAFNPVKFSTSSDSIIRDFVVDGNNMYFALESEYNNKQIYNVIKTEFTFDGSSFSLTQDPDSQTADLTPYDSNALDIGTDVNEIEINDMQILDDYLYVLISPRLINSFQLIKNDGGNQYITSTGGVVKLQLSDFDGDSAFTGEDWDDNSEGDGTFIPKVLGWYKYDNLTRAPDNSNYNYYFYGPRKFIAVDPYKLVIADDGFMFASGIRITNANRVIVIEDPNSNYSFEVTNVEVTFNGYLADAYNFKY